MNWIALHLESYLIIKYAPLFIATFIWTLIFCFLVLRRLKQFVLHDFYLFLISKTNLKNYISQRISIFYCFFFIKIYIFFILAIMAPFSKSLNFPFFLIENLENIIRLDQILKISGEVKFLVGVFQMSMKIYFIDFKHSVFEFQFQNSAILMNEIFALKNNQ